MVVLSQSLISPSGKPYTDPETVPADLVHNSSLHLTFAKYGTHTKSSCTDFYLLVLSLPSPCPNVTLIFTLIKLKRPDLRKQHFYINPAS